MRTPLLRYKGPIVLRDDAQAPVSVPRNYLSRPVYNRELTTLEQELAEIRARHAARREYNRVANAARQARRRAAHAVDHRAVDEPTT